MIATLFRYIHRKTRKLPNLPSELLRIAIHDIQTCAGQSKHFVIDLEEYHVTGCDHVCSACMHQDKCRVGLAGAVMAQTLGIGAQPVSKYNHKTSIGVFTADVCDKLLAIQSMSTGSMMSTFAALKLEKPDTIPKQIDMPKWEGLGSNYVQHLIGLCERLKNAGF